MITTTSNPALVRLEHLEVFYGDVQALWDVSLEVGKGELVALVGANGAGKTTTLRTLAGVLRPRRGHILFADREIQSLSAHLVADLGIALVPEGRALFAPLTVEENLVLGSYLPRVRPRRTANLERVYSLFPRLRERRKQQAGTLSGGEQQMVAIGRALMSEPQVLIFDEPSLGLAPIIVQEVFKIITSLRDEGLTMLLVEQNVAQTLRVADRAYVIENGRIVLSGTGQALSENPEVRAAYLGL